MKGCLSALAALTMGVAALFAFVKIREWRMTPEERAAEIERETINQKQQQITATAEAEERRAKNIEVNEARQPYLEELVKIEGVERARFSDVNTIQIELAPLMHIGEDHVRVICEKVAAGWAARVGLKHARCEEWYGAKRYAVGEYNGPVPEAYIAKVVNNAMQEQHAKDSAALVALEGKTLPEVEGTHGPAIYKSKDTGWAEFKTFRVRFANGKVEEVSVK